MLLRIPKRHAHRHKRHPLGGAPLFVFGLQKYAVFATKGFVQNLQYRASHLVNSVASAVFGLIYIHIWLAVTPPEGFGDYTARTMVYYVAFNQTILWLTQFGVRVHLKVSEAVRSGNIGSELVRPVDYFGYRVSQEMGSQTYSLLFRGLPVGLILSFVGYYFPARAVTWLWTFIALALAGYVFVVIQYMVGISAFWTQEIRTLTWVSLTLAYGMGGASMPLEVLPPLLEKVARLSPFACLAFYPARIYLELSDPDVIWFALFWAVSLTMLARYLTRLARRVLEVSGG